MKNTKKKMNNKRQILTAIIAVLISVGLIATAVFATTTVGNDVTVGGDLTVAGTLSMSVATTTGSLAAIVIDAAAIEANTTGLTVDISAITGGAFTEAGLAIVLGGSADTSIGIVLEGNMDFGINMSTASVTSSDIVLQNSETIANTTDGTIAFSDGTTTVSLRPALTGANMNVLTMGTSTAKLDFSSMTGSNAGASIYLTASSTDAKFIGLEVNLTDTGSTGANYVQGLRSRVTKSGGAATVSGASESYIWGINNEATLSGGSVSNAWGAVTTLLVTGTPTIGAAGDSPNQAAALYAMSYVATTTTMTDVLDAPIIASVIDDAAGPRHKATAAVLAVLRGGYSATTTAGAAFKVMDMISEANLPGSNFDYGLDLYNVDTGAGRGYANVFAVADIRLSNGATIANTGTNDLVITEATTTFAGGIAITDTVRGISAGGSNVAWAPIAWTGATEWMQIFLENQATAPDTSGIVMSLTNANDISGSEILLELKNYLAGDTTSTATYLTTLRTRLSLREDSAMTTGHAQSIYVELDSAATANLAGADLHAGYFYMYLQSDPGNAEILRLENNSTDQAYLDTHIHFFGGDSSYALIFDAPDTTSWNAAETGTNGSMAGWIKVKVGSADRWIRLYDAAN